MSAFLLCFAAMAALALAMDRHHDDAFAAAGAAPRWTRVQWPWLAHPLWHPVYLRRAGWGLLWLSLWLTAAAPGTAAVLMPPMSLRIVVWVVALSVAAVAVTAVVTWQPQRAPALAAIALVAGLCALALGW